MALPADKAHLRPNTPLIEAADHGHADAVRCLLEHSPTVNLNERGYLGATALSRAARRGHTEICDLLLSAGADPDIPNCKVCIK